MTAPATSFSLMRTAFLQARANPTSFILLGLLVGLVSAIVLTPATRVLQTISEKVSGAETTDAANQAALSALEAGMGMLVISALGSMLVSAVGLVPWVRLVAGRAPLEGGLPRLALKGVKAFVHLLAATGILLVFALLLVSVGGLLSSLIGPAAVLLDLLVALILIVLFLLAHSMAHYAIALEALDRTTTIFTAWAETKENGKAMTGALGLLFALAFGVNLILGNVVVALLPGAVANLVTMVLGPTLFFLARALQTGAVIDLVPVDTPAPPPGANDQDR
ncbi:hypothetical protein [Yunchengibacter salinarum]|uniref:hypothetical protein n=1 Tax=Yunchengibacter salinarum TaxID=3133399 RepID=UPI0035B5A78C